MPLPPPRRLVRLAGLLTVVVVLAAAGGGCGGRTSGMPAILSGKLTIVAPPSLTEAMAQITTVFETAHPAVEVTTEFPVPGGATDADVVVTEATPPAKGFAANQLVIAVALGNPRHISQLSDLAQPRLRVARCDPARPCGAAADSALTGAGVRLRSPILLDDVRAARAAVEQGRADAALVYRTDARLAANRMDTVEFTQSRTATIVYQVVASAHSANPMAAAAFVALLSQSSTVDSLTTMGFQHAN